MSKLLLSPNYCSCTVHQARNLPDKGKNGGVDAFCTISMGKEKFVTAVREKTRTPEWQEQCDMPIVDDARIKLTVYHNTKSALSKGDFIGRALVSLRDLQDYDHVHRSWYKLANKDGKFDKDRGEIDVSLQFYSKNNTTGSVLDLATKKKHLSLKDIKHSLGSKLKTAAKHKKNDNYAAENQSTSFAGSHMSLNSMSYNNNHVEPPQKKMPRAPSSGLGSTLGTGTGTPHSSRRSVTSDYDTSSILDSASMYGGDEPSTPSPPVRSQVQQQSQQHQQREVYVGDELPPRSNSTRRKKTKEPSPSAALPSILTPKASNNSPPSRLTENSRSFSVTGDDIEAAFDAINDYKSSMHESANHKPKEPEISSPDSLFGLSTIKEAIDHDENAYGGAGSHKQQSDTEIDEIDFDNCLNKYKPYQNQTKPNEEVKTKKTFAPSAPAVQQSQQKPQETKSTRHLKEQKRTTPSFFDDIQTPTASIASPRIESTPSPVAHPPLPMTNQKETIPSTIEDNDSNDEDVDELLGKLEMPRAPSSGLGSTLGTGTGTPHSSRRSVTSDYDTSSILDSASMYGGDEPSTPSPPVRSQVQQQSQQHQQREVYVGDELPPRSNSTRRKKTKEPSPSAALPSILTPKASNNSPPSRLTENSRSFSVTGDDIEAAFDAINDYKSSMHESANHKPKEPEISSPDSLFGLSTIKEAIDHDENAYGGAGSHKQQSDTEIDEIDFDNCLNKYKPYQNQTKPSEEVKTKKTFAPSAPTVQQPQQKSQETKSTRHLKEQKRTTPSFFDDIQTPTASIASPRIESTPSPVAHPPLPMTNQKETIPSTIEDNDSNDEDVDELLGKLERMSSIRSSVKRKIQPKDDIMQQSFTELESPTNNKFANGYTQNQSSYYNRQDKVGSTALPDIVGEQSVKNSSQNSAKSSVSSNKKSNDNGLCVLGYENVKSAPVHPKVRQELDYLDREELLHVIAYQCDLLKKRDSRLKDLESYTDSLLVKILEQCPTILQSGSLKYNGK